MKKILSAILFISGFALIYFCISNDTNNEESLSSLLAPDVILTNAIHKDLFELKTKGELPEQWDSLKSVKINTEMLGSNNLRPQLKISTKSDGKFLLECIILNENPLSKDGRYLVKYSIYDSKNNNQLWERFRLYKRP